MYRPSAGVAPVFWCMGSSQGTACCSVVTSVPPISGLLWQRAAEDGGPENQRMHHLEQARSQGGKRCFGACPRGGVSQVNPGVSPLLLCPHGLQPLSHHAQGAPLPGSAQHPLRYYGCGLVVPECLASCRILDLGSGSGRDCYLLSQLVGEQGHVTGIDMTEGQVCQGARASPCSPQHSPPIIPFLLPG